MSKISDLSDGGSLQSTDFLVAVRSGGNVKVQADDLTLDTLTVEGTLRVPNNEKLIFGTSSTELEVYYSSGPDVVLMDSPSAPLQLGASQVNIASYGGTNYAVFDSTGVDVTGTVTADGLTVDGVGSITSSSTELLDLTSTGGDSLIRFGSLNSSFDVRIGSPSNPSAQGGAFVIRTAGDDRLNIANNGDLSLYEDTGTTAKFFWDASAERLGLGTSSPDFTLDVAGVITRERSSSGSTASPVTDQVVGLNAGGNFAAGLTASNTNASNFDVSLGFVTRNASGDGVERVRIDADGNVGIGTSTINERLVLGSADSGSNFLQITNSTTTAANDRGFYLGIDANEAARILNRENTDMVFSTNNTEAMRIDSSQNFLVGVDTNTTTTSAEGFVYNNGGSLLVTRDGAPSAYFTRLSSDSDIAVFRKGIDTVGSIGVNNGTNLYVGSDGQTGLKFGSTDIVPADSNNSGGSSDADMNLGSSSTRFKDLYLSGGVYLGGTGAANQLDDYETGGWTPEIADAVSGGNTGSATASRVIYTKVGRLVTVSAQLINVDTTGMTSGSTLYIRGLPFTSASANIAFGSMQTDNLTFRTSRTQIVPMIVDSDTYLTIRNIGDGLSDLSTLVSDVSSGTTDIYFSITYHAA